MHSTLLAPSQAMGQRLRGFGPWLEFVNTNFPWLDLSSSRSAEFSAIASFRAFGNRSLATIISNDCCVSRPIRAADRSDAGYLKVLWQRAGSTLVEQDGTSTRLQRGMSTICDTARPYRLWLTDDSSFVVLMLPYDAISGWERISQKVSATALQDQASVNAALAATLSLLRTPCENSTHGADTVLQAVQWMLSAAVHQMLSPSKASPAIKLERVHQHILSHIDDPDLTPDELAAALHVSRRTLYQLFKEKDVTPGRFIRDVRLEAVRDALALPCNTRRSIYEIALDHGFNNNASFSRMFKAAFGMNPSDWRIQQFKMAAPC